MITLKCEFRAECTDPVTMVDPNGFIYCAAHGEARRSWKRCRKLRPHELNRLRAGKQLAQY